MFQFKTLSKTYDNKIKPIIQFLVEQFKTRTTVGDYENSGKDYNTLNKYYPYKYSTTNTDTKE